MHTMKVVSVIAVVLDVPHVPADRAVEGFSHTSVQASGLFCVQCGSVSCGVNNLTCTNWDHHRKSVPKKKKKS